MIASAVDQQSSATREIAGNVQQASTGTSDVNQNILGVTQAADSAGAAAAKLLAASNDLSSQSAQLKNEVGSFLASIRAA
jgi:methyl-accepting chemotaxis protein